MNKLLLLCITICSLLAYYFSGVGFGFDLVEQIVVGLITFLLLYEAGRGGWQRFYVVAISTFSFAVSLGCAFLNPGGGSGPFAINLQLNPAVIVFLSVVAGIGVLFWDKYWKSKNRFAVMLLVVFVINWIILGINVKYFDDWKLENYLTVPFIILIFITHRWFRLSNLSYGLIFAYMMFHICGTHYTYSEVPLGFWLQDVLDMTRNHYDRIVHFGFGLLLAYPLREMTVRISEAKGFWGFWFPVEFVLAFSCIYELIEWGIAVLFGGDLGVAYLGTQGDVWDAQKDMFLAGLGSIVAMLIVFAALWYLNRSKFMFELKNSFKVKHKEAMGEEALKRLETIKK